MTGLVPHPHRPRLDPANRRFGEFVRAERQKKRLGVCDFAHKIGMAAGHLTNIENARVTPPQEEVIHHMAKALDLPPGTLMAMAGKLGTHAMRKTFAHGVYKALGRDLVNTQRALGHKNVNSTVSYLGFETDAEINKAILSL